MLKTVPARLAAASVFALAAAGIAAPAAAKKIEGSYICVFKPGAVGKGQEKDRAEKAVKANNGTLKHV